MEYWKSDLWDGVKDSLQKNCDGKHWVPHFHDIFKPFLLCPLRKVKVVFIGDGLVPGVGKADGLAFSYYGLSAGSEEAASVTRAIHMELKRDLDLKGLPTTGNLAHWAREGVLLLNTNLTRSLEDTKEEHDVIWNDLVTEVILEAADVNPDVAFILVGDRASELAGNLSVQGNYFTVETDYPRYDAYGGNNFYGSCAFSKVNKFLKSIKRGTIKWELPGCNRY